MSSMSLPLRPFAKTHPGIRKAARIERVILERHRLSERGGGVRQPPQSLRNDTIEFDHGEILEVGCLEIIDHLARFLETAVGRQSPCQYQFCRPVVRIETHRLRRLVDRRPLRGVRGEFSADRALQPDDRGGAAVSNRMLVTG